MSSPKPATNPTIAALAPNDPRNGPTIPRAPSYVKSAKKFTMPMIRTNWSADRFLITTNGHGLARIGRVRHALRPVFQQSNVASHSSFGFRRFIRFVFIRAYWWLTNEDFGNDRRAWAGEHTRLLPANHCTLSRTHDGRALSGVC